jgi:membrane protease YdiL (CAAX protease family)
MNRVRTINFVFFATVLLSLVGHFINQWIYNYTDNYFIILLVSQIILVLPSAIYLALSKNSIGKAIRFNKIKGSNVILIIIFSYLISPLMTLINAISMLFVENDTVGVMENIVSNNGFIISLFVIAFIPCILEETVYRGIFYNEYRKISPIKGILLSAFLFGIMHMNFNQFSYAFVMGMVFALLIEATDSILSTMIVHFFINGNSVLIMYLYPKMMELFEKVYGPGYFNSSESIEAIQASIQMDLNLVLRTYAFPALIGSVLAFIVYRAIAKNSGRWGFIKGIFKKDENIELSSFQDTVENNPPYEQKKRLITVSLLIGILVCLILMISSEIISQMPAPTIDEINTTLSIYISHILS